MRIKNVFSDSIDSGSLLDIRPHLKESDDSVLCHSAVISKKLKNKICGQVCQKGVTKE